MEGRKKKREGMEREEEEKEEKERKCEPRGIVTRLPLAVRSGYLE